MKKLKAIYDSFFSLELPMNQVLFNIATITAFIGGLLSLPLNITYFAPYESACILAAVTIDAFCIYIANYRNALRAATIIICSMVSLVIFPLLFITGGGANSGMESWFMLGIIFVFMLLDGMDFFFMLLMNFAVVLGCYYVGFAHPEIFPPSVEDKYVYADTAQGIVITTLAIGMIIKFQNGVYRKLYAKAEDNSDELLERTLEAKKAERQAQTATEAKSNFLANMSHEIRTPINTIMGMDEMILRETSEKKVEEYALDIKSASQTLLGLINDILDISKIESGKMEILRGDYDFMSLMHDTLNNATVRANEKDLKLETEVDENIPCELIGDDMRLRQVLTNIITNAVKYTHEGSVKITVKLINVVDNQADIFFAVSDTGIGIKEEDMSRLFTSFERIEVSRNRNIEGAGLGMAITQNLLKLMGSELKVESVYGEGSTFSFTLTQGIARPEPVGDFNERLANLSTGYQYTTSFEAPDAHFLVVDDNAMNRKVAVALLKESKVKVTEASGGREALRLMQNRHYDMIFMDHMMPGMDGIETFKAMFSLPENQCLDTPVIALTANAVAGAKERYLALGFHGFLSKPIIPSQLEKVIRDFLPDTLLVTHKTNDLEEVRANRTSKIEFPDVEGIDWEYALLHFPDSNLVLQTAIDFYNGISYEKEELLNLFAAMETEEKPIDDYRIKVHAIKSMANTIGATSLGALAKSLEFAARDGKLDRITLLTPVLVEEMETMEHRMRVQFDSQIQKPAIEDLGELFAMLEMLKMAILTKDTEAADNSMQLIRGYAYEPQTQSQIDVLDKYVINMEYDEALLLIDTLQN